MMAMLTPHLGHVTDEGYRIFYGQRWKDRMLPPP